VRKNVGIIRQDLQGLRDLQDFFAKAKTGFTGFCFLRLCETSCENLVKPRAKKHRAEKNVGIIRQDLQGLRDLQDFFAKAKTGFTGFCFLKPRAKKTP
jgi:hypothetical protein